MRSIEAVVADSNVVAHVILGIPGESHSMMMQTADEIGRLRFDSVKLHNLYAVRGTPLGDEVLEGKIEMMRRDDYVHTVVDFLERIPPEVIVERVSGDAPPNYLIEPKWCLEKSALRLEIESEFRRRGTRQGSRYTPADPTPADPTPADPTPGMRAVPDDLTPEAIRVQIENRRRLPVLKLEQ